MIPYELRLKLRSDIRKVFTMNTAYKAQLNAVVNPALDTFIDSWWTNHKNIISVMSSTPEWDWDHLAIVKHKNLAGEVDFVKAFHLFRGMIYRAHDQAALGSKSDGPNVYQCGVTIPQLRDMMIELFEELILDGLPLSKCKAGSKNNKPYLSAAIANNYKEFLSKDENRPSYKVDTEDGKSTYVDRFEEVFGSKFGRYPEQLFSILYESTSKGTNYIRSDYDNLRNQHRSLLTNHLSDPTSRQLFKISFLRYLGVDKVSNKTGEGVDKTSVINKMIDYYFKLTFVLTVNNSFPASNGTQRDNINDFMFGTESLNGVLTPIWFQLPKEITVKNRDSRGRFVLENRAQYNQVLNLITQAVHSTYVDETYVLSVHPCDLINGSLGNTWGSCHAFSNRYPENNGVSYYNYGEGGYHGGNFGFAAGHGLIYFIPQKIYKDVPLWQTPRVQRQWIWVNAELTAIRQNFFYPGRPSDKESNRRAQELRVYLQNLFASFNGTTGTADWRIGKTIHDTPYKDISVNGSSMAYGDPIMSRVYVSKEKAPKVSDIIYSANCLMFNNPVTRWGISSHRTIDDNPGASYCRVCGTRLSSSNRGSYNHICSTCEKDFVECSVTGEVLHPTEMMKVGGKYFSYEGFVQMKDKFRYCEDTKQLEDEYTVVTNSLKQEVYYHDSTHKDIGQCKVCHAYFTADVLIDGYCPEHLPSDNISIESIESKFRSGTFALSFDDVDQARNILVALGKVSTLKWKSGRGLHEFVPPTNTVVLFVHKDAVITVNKNRYEGMTLDVSTIAL